MGPHKEERLLSLSVACSRVKEWVNTHLRTVNKRFFAAMPKPDEPSRRVGRRRLGRLVEAPDSGKARWLKEFRLL